jgi:lipopolysaccharide transport system ATP-binding protein
VSATLVAKDLSGGHGHRILFEGLDLTVAPGDVIGVVGANGAGKSTLLKLLAGITEPTEGRARVNGQMGSLLEVGTGFHPDLTGRDNIFLNGAVLGMRRSDIARRFDEIVEFAGISRFLDTPVKRYSSGMYVRLAFAVAAHLDPDILLVDEVLSVGDQAFQEKSLGRIRDVTQSGRTVIFVSHNIASVTGLCNRGVLIERGRLTQEGSIRETVEAYLSRTRTLAGEGLLGDVERDGTGEIQFQSVRVVGEDGSGDLYSDRPMTFSITFATQEAIPGHQVNIGLGINTMLGERLVTLYTRFDPRQEVRAGDLVTGSVVKCVVPELPLQPGNYLLTLYVDRGGQLADRVQNQVEFTLSPSDYFGSGTMPTDSHGPFLVPHRWRMDSAGALDPQVLR